MSALDDILQKETVRELHPYISNVVKTEIKTLMLKTMREANYDPYKFAEAVEKL